MAHFPTVENNTSRGILPLTDRSFFPCCVVALLVTVLVTVASFPGYMSYDSIQELLQARTHVEGSQYPPFGSYVWRIFDWIAPGPTLMQLVQNGLLLCSFAYLVSRTRLPLLFKIACIVVFTAMPPILGTMVVVWKDVAVGACYMAVLALLISYPPDASRGRKRLVTALAMFFVWCGMAYRFNAASGAVPLIIYAMWRLSEGRGPAVVARILVKSAFITALLFALVWVLNNFRFPNFERLERNTVADALMAWDLVGISAFSGDAIVPSKESGSTVSPDYIKRIYDPRHINLTTYNDREHRVTLLGIPDVKQRWVTAVVRHPAAYLEHRVAVFREYIGLHEHDVFLPTQSDVEPNTLGVTSTPTPFKQHVVNYLWDARLTSISRAWVYYAVTFVLILATFVARTALYRAEMITAALSGYLYLLPMFIITPAADLRYNFPSICGCVVASVFALASLFEGRKASARGMSPGSFTHRS